MLQATGKRCIVQRIMETATAGGIILQRDLNTNPPCTVVSCGPGVTAEIQTGSTVYIDWGRAGKFAYEDTEYFIVEETNILGVVEE